MALSRPTIIELVARIEADFISRITGITAILRNSFLKVAARVYAGAVHLLYGSIDNYSLELFVTTATGIWLEAHADKWGITRKAATFSSGSITITGTDTSVIPAGTEYQNSNGDEYTTDVEGIVSGGSISVNVTAVNPGSDPNILENEIVSLLSPISGVDSDATVDVGGLSGGAPEETDEQLRTRILERISSPPMGGSENDYIAWVKETPELNPTRVWVYGNYNGPGTVGVFFVLDDLPNIIPNVAAIEAVQEYLGGWAGLGDTTIGSPIITNISNTDGIAVGQSITVAAGFSSPVRYFEVIAKTTTTLTINENAIGDTTGVELRGINGVAPVTAAPIVYAPAPKEVYFDVSISPNRSDVQEAITASLAFMFINEAAPGMTLLISHINEAISTAQGEEDHVVNEIYVGGSPVGVGNFAFNGGDLPVFDDASMIYSSL